MTQPMFKLWLPLLAVCAGCSSHFFFSERFYYYDYVGFDARLGLSVK